MSVSETVVSRVGVEMTLGVSRLTGPVFRTYQKLKKEKVQWVYRVYVGEGR